MSFDQQVNNLRGSNARYSVFNEGVKYKWMTGAAGILFKLLPAYDYNLVDGTGAVSPVGTVACRDADNGLTSWGSIIHLCRYVGHGSGRSGNRKDFVSMATFDANAYDPISVLHQTASMYPEWDYVVNDVLDGKTLVSKAVLNRPSEFLACNVVVLGTMDAEACVLGLFTKSAMNAIVGREHNGLVHQRANNCTPEMIAQAPMLQWALGDITHVDSGPVLYVAKGTDRGEYSGYQVGLSVDGTNNVRQHKTTDAVLAGRYDLSKPDNFLQRPNAEQTVQELVEVLNGRSPTGHHEHELLKLAFGDQFSIPEPPAAVAATATVPGANLGTPPGGAGFGLPAAMAPQAAGPVPMTAAGPVPQVAPSMAPATPATPVATGPAPVSVANPAPQMQHVASAPSVAAAPVAALPSEGATGLMPAANPVAEPIAPGDEVAGFDRNAFLGKLASEPTGAPPQAG